MSHTPHVLLPPHAGDSGVAPEADQAQQVEAAGAGGGGAALGPPKHVAHLQYRAVQ